MIAVVKSSNHNSRNIIRNTFSFSDNCTKKYPKQLVLLNFCTHGKKHDAKRINSTFPLPIVSSLTHRMASVKTHCHNSVFVSFERNEVLISFYYKPKPQSKYRLFNLVRQADEPLDKALWKISHNIQKYVAGKRKHKQDDIPSLVKARLLSASGEDVDVTLENLTSWKKAETLVITYFDEARYSVVADAPVISSVELPLVCMVGFPVFPRHELLRASFEHTIFEWFRISNEYVRKAKLPKRNDSLDPDTAALIDKQVVYTGLTYTPTEDDLEHYLMVQCTPSDAVGRQGLVQFAVGHGAVSRGPSVCLADSRIDSLNRQSVPNRLRVVSYNILAKMYADSDYAREVLFPYCPKDCLVQEYRKHLLLRELKGYDADVVCLQEVDESFFKHDLLPSMHLLGYSAHLRTKYGTAAEGSATFFKTTKYRLLDEVGIELGERIRNAANNADIRHCLDSNEAIKKETHDRSTAANVLVLESLETPGRCLCVLNTHLYFAPFASVIRLLQSLVCVRELMTIQNRWREKGYTTSVLFCGDLNTSPDHAVYELLTRGHISRQHTDWSRVGPRPRSDEEYTPVDGFDASHSLHLASACDSPITNYTSGFKGCLDYIFFDTDTLEILQNIPMPSDIELERFGYIPNAHAPSDHLALVTDLIYKPC